MLISGVVCHTLIFRRQSKNWPCAYFPYVYYRRANKRSEQPQNTAGQKIDEEIEAPEAAADAEMAQQIFSEDEGEIGTDWLETAAVTFDETDDAAVKHTAQPPQPPVLLVGGACPANAHGSGYESEEISSLAKKRNLGAPRQLGAGRKLGSLTTK